MKYVSYRSMEKLPSGETLGSSILVRALKAILPSANPDFDSVLDGVESWWLELNDSDQPTREIGFDNLGNAIFAAPLGRNRGVFTDSGFPCEDFNPIAPDAFELKWHQFVLQHTRSNSE